MQEQLLHFVWQYQYFSPDRLVTESGQKVRVIDPGTYNEHGGPDFLFALISSSGMEWRGHVEIHVRASDWNNHNHHLDPAYDAVVLHVVWENDREVFRSDGTILPTIVLRDKITLSVFRRFTDLSASLWHIPCRDLIGRVNDSTVHKAMDRSLRARMRSRTGQIIDLLQKNGSDWEETAFRLLLKYAGSGSNQEAFDRLSQLVRYRTLKRHGDRPDQVAAILFGVAGMLDGPAKDTWHQQLKAEYAFLKGKYNLPGMAAHQWKFLRMRPASFPGRRIAALAELVCRREGFFRFWTDKESVAELRKFFVVRLPEYWKSHSHFGRSGAFSDNGFGKYQAYHFIINVIFPLKLAYHAYRGLPQEDSRARTLYAQLPAENNRYIRMWAQAGVKGHNAADTQAMLGHYKQYCRRRKCLDCPVGVEIISA